jgi:hypothetical protein
MTDPVPHGKHWPREEQIVNAPDGSVDLSGDERAAQRVRARWAAVLTAEPRPDEAT